MSNLSDPIEQPALYISAEHSCSYLPGNASQTLFIDPSFAMDMPLYQTLIDQGFRRSGRLVYRPHCRHCQACVPLRLPVKEFQPKRSQRRCRRNNYSRLEVTPCAPTFNEERFQLYQRYTKDRHTGAGMDDSSPEQFSEFLTTPWCNTRFYEFRQDGQLSAVAVTDLLPKGLSAVYSFFDPGVPELSLGVYTLLWQIEEANKQGLPWLYLGYWISRCRKMNYKDQYRPTEAWTGAGWQRFGKGEAIEIPA